MRIKEEYKEEYKQKITSIHRNIEDAIISYFSLCKIGEITKTFTFDKLTMFCAQDSLNCLQTIITSLKKRVLSTGLVFVLRYKSLSKYNTKTQKQAK